MKGAVMPSVKFSKTDREEALERLQELITGETTIYTILRSVSTSGMSRRMSVKVIDSKGDLLDITYYVGGALGYPVSDIYGHRVIRVNGCGMDMGFIVVYDLSHTLFNGQDRAGYVLRHEWAQSLIK